MECPFCGKSDCVIKYGKDRQTCAGTEKKERQRYRCKDCKKVFYDKNDYIKPKGKSDIRVKLLAIMLRHSDFDLAELNEFFGYTPNASEIQLWEKEYLKFNFSNIRMPYMKSHSYAHHSNEIELTRENVIKWIEKGTAKKGIYIALDDDYSISYVDIFDETKK